jgi:hypothetical protein
VLFCTAFYHFLDEVRLFIPGWEPLSIKIYTRRRKISNSTRRFFDVAWVQYIEGIIVMTKTGNRRIFREQKTIEAMIDLSCNGQHGTRGDLCAECRELKEYACKRLERCPFREKKTTCANCRVHCYKHDMQEKIKQVMRYAGPRMTYRHPVLALYHFIDGFRKPPEKKKAGR